VTVVGGIATFTNLADSIPETISLKFTSGTLTSATSSNIVVSPANFTIFGNTAPTNPSQNDANSTYLGVKFESSQAGFITGIRFYKGNGNTGAHVGYLWTSGGTLLAQANFTGETASGWQQVSFSSPFSIAANTIYVASYFAPNGHYADDQNYFAGGGVTNGPLTALANSTPGGNGVFVYANAGEFPNRTYKASNYYVDVMFSTTNPMVLTQPPSGHGRSMSGARGVFLGTTSGDFSTAALDAMVAEWLSSDSSTSRISRILHRLGAGEVAAFSSSTVARVLSADTLSSRSTPKQHEPDSP
jgi:hypothetical protein